MNIERLGHLLRSQDWDAGKSDDSRVCERAERSLDEIMRLIAEVPPAEGRKLWEQNARSDQPYPAELLERSAVQPEPKYAAEQTLSFEAFNSLMLRPVSVKVRVLSHKIEKGFRGLEVKYRVEVESVPRGANGLPVTNHIREGEQYDVEEYRLKP